MKEDLEKKEEKLNAIQQTNGELQSDIAESDRRISNLGKIEELENIQRTLQARKDELYQSLANQKDEIERYSTIEKDVTKHLTDLKEIYDGIDTLISENSKERPKELSVVQQDIDTRTIELGELNKRYAEYKNKLDALNSEYDNALVHNNVNRATLEGFERGYDDMVSHLEDSKQLLNTVDEFMKKQIERNASTVFTDWSRK